MRTFTFLGHTFEIVSGPSVPNPGLRRQYRAAGVSFLSTADIKMWIGIDGREWFIIRDPIQFVEYGRLAETEDELFDFLETLSYDFKAKRMVKKGVLPEQP